MFSVGQKVVCVDDSPGHFARQRHLLRNSIYTVRGFCENSHGDIGLLLEEVRPNYPTLLNGQERGFYAHRFRPITERKTDISSLKALLVPGPKISETV